VNERDVLYLEHVLDAIDAIRRFTSTGEAAFLGDDLVQSAVIRQLEIIGEAVKRLSTELTSAEASVPWKEIARTRDLLIHATSALMFVSSGTWSPTT
jgi:uncharacterized protein with HEPN domain